MAIDQMATRKTEYHVREDEARELRAAQVRLSEILGARPHLILHPILYLTPDEIVKCREYLAEIPPNLAAVREVFAEARTRYPKYEAQAA